MDLQIDIELPQKKQPSYYLSAASVTEHFRDVMALLKKHDVSQEQAAAAVGLAPITLTAYARGVGNAAHRTIPAPTLDRLRDLAMDAFWKDAAWPYRLEIGGEDRAHLTPIYTALDETGLVRERHPHPLRIQELADKLGTGAVRVTWSANPRVTEVPPLDAEASLRSRWRLGADFIYLSFEDAEDAADVLCEIADCDRYSLWKFSTEYRPWRIQVTRSQVERLEAAIEDLDRGDEIQPWESEIQKALADLEDF